MNLSVKNNLKSLLKGKKILLGVSGSIAAFKSCDLVRFLKDCGAEVRVVLTESAEKFVTPLTLETLSGQKVLRSLWDDEAQGTHHIDLARWADLVLVAPATANMVAKLAHGLANDLLTTEILAFDGPVAIAPAMNPVMFNHPAVQDNMALLRKRGVKILGPDWGETACGEEGLGRMLEVDEIIELVAATFIPRKKNPKKVLITLGPTRSALDPVRYLTNRSSGKMGAALAWEAWKRGYEVEVISGPVDVALPRSIERIKVKTADEMFDAAQGRWGRADYFIGTAAVLDWDIAEPSLQKMKKDAGEPELNLKKNPDILAWVGAHKRPQQKILGFAAETENFIENARKKLINKNCDAVFVNDVSDWSLGFESANNAGWWVSAEGEEHLPLMSKEELAQKIFDRFSFQPAFSRDRTLDA